MDDIVYVEIHIIDKHEEYIKSIMRERMNDFNMQRFKVYIYWTDIFKSNNLKEILFFNKYDLHHEHSPALIIFNTYGEIIQETWYNHGRKHRLDGPAQIIYKNKQIQFVDWWINNQYISNAPKHWPLNEQEQIELKLKHA